MLMLVVEKETRHYAELSFHGVMEFERVACGRFSMIKNPRYGVYWDVGRKILKLRIRNNVESHVKVRRDTLPWLVSLVMKHNGLADYLPVTDGVYYPFPVDLFGEYMEEVGPFSFGRDKK